MTPVPDRSLRAAIASAWRVGGSTRTQPILVASVCAGVIGFTLARVAHLNVVLSYAITVAVVFALTTAVLVYRDR